MGNEKNYSVMTVKDIIYRVLAGWKLVVVLLVLGAIAGNWFSGKAYSKSETKYNEYIASIGFDPAEEEDAAALSTAEQADYAEKRAEKWKSMIDESQKLSIENALSIKELMNETDEYSKNAIIMQLDPYNVNYVAKVYQISTEVEGLTAKVLPLYSSYAQDGGLIEAVAEDLGWKNGEDSLIYSSLLTQQSQNGNQVKVNLYVRSADEAEKASNALDTAFSALSKEFNKKYGIHTITAVESVTGTKGETSIADHQNSVQSKQTGYFNQINSLVNTYNSKPTVLNYYRYRLLKAEGGTGFEKATLDSKQEVVNKPVQRKKLFILAGALAGIMAAVVIILMFYLANGRLIKTEEMVSIFKLPYIGCVVRESRIFIVDRLIKAAFLRSDGPYDRKIRAKLVASKIEGICKERNIQSIVLVGTWMDKADKRSIARLSEYLKEKGINVAATGNMLKDVEVSDAALQNKNVIIAETVEKSSYKTIEKEIAMLNGCELNILGAFCIA